MLEREDRKPNEARRREAKPSPPVVRAEELFQGHREICLEHAGKRYRRRITRRNKLILQK
jgi:hemin uptake protein HemP